MPASVSPWHAVDAAGAETVKGYAVIYRHRGKQRREYADTLAAARALQADRRSAVANHEHVIESAITLHAYVADWIERYRGRGGRQTFRENTRREYRRLLDAYALAYFPPGMRLRELTPHDLARFVAWLGDPAKQDGRKLSTQSMRNAVNPLRAALASARREGLIRANPASELVIAGAHEHDDDHHEAVRALEPEQLRTLLAIAPERYRLLIELLAATGLRISEAVALRRFDVVTEPERVARNGQTVTLAPRVCVRRALVRGRLDKPKSKYGIRDVTLPAALAGKLSDHLATRPAGADVLVFASRNETPIDADNVRARHLKTLGGEIGAPWIGWHTLRHSYASLQLAAGVNVKQLQRALGHHSAAFTLDTYAHLLRDGEAPALDVWTETAADDALTVDAILAAEQAEPETA